LYTHFLVGKHSFVEARAQTALDGCGKRPWTPEYVLTIVEEIRDRAAEALKAASDEDE
jgi:hypothetical protein